MAAATQATEKVRERLLELAALGRGWEQELDEALNGGDFPSMTQERFAEIMRGNKARKAELAGLEQQIAAA